VNVLVSVVVSVVKSIFLSVVVVVGNQIIALYDDVFLLYINCYFKHRCQMMYIKFSWKKAFTQSAFHLCKNINTHLHIHIDT
jgi:hypothetical protein